MAEIEDVVERLDRLIALLRLAYSDRIQAARDLIAPHPVDRALLEHAADEWLGAGELKKLVMDSTGQSNSTVKARLASLVEAEVLSKRGAGPKTEYRSTGII